MKVLAPLDLQAGKVINLGDPTAPQDAATKAYVDANGGGGGGGGGLTQIGSTLTVTSGASATFTAIPGGHGAIMVEILGLSHGGGSSQALQLELSPNGSTWTAATAISGSVAAAAAIYGSILIPGYRNDAGIALRAANDHSANNTVVAALSGLGWRISGGIQAIRLVWSGGASFDATGAGQLRLWGW